MRFLNHHMKILFVALFLSNQVHAGTLSEVVKEKLQQIQASPKLEGENVWIASTYNPIQYFEYRYGRSDELNKRYYRVPWNDEGGETHTLRIHIKSLTEILNGRSSQAYSQELLESERRSVLNQRQFDIYLDLVNQVLQQRLHRMLGAREGELNKGLEDTGQMMGLAKADVKDLVKELERLQKVNVELEAASARATSDSEMSDAAAAELIDSVGDLAKRLANEKWDGDKLEIQRKRIESKLSRLDKEIAWAKDRKWIDHFDIQRDTLEREDAFRIGFNIPWLRFDNGNRARDKALLLAKESEIERESSQLESELKRKRLDVLSYAAQVESLKSRVSRTKGIAKKIKGVQDVELRAVIGDFTFELERDVLLQSL